MANILKGISIVITLVNISNARAERYLAMKWSVKEEQIATTVIATTPIAISNPSR